MKPNDPSVHVEVAENGRIPPPSGLAGERIAPQSGAASEPLAFIAGIRRPADLERIRSSPEAEATTVHYGCDQNWYQDPFQQKAGCGPCAAANLIDYAGRPLLDGPAASSSTPADFDRLMHEVWHYVTPGLMGVHRARHLADGLDRYALGHGLPIRSVRLDIPVRRSRRPGEKEVVAFIREGLEADSPVAFLNRSNGTLIEPESWHWVTITALYRLPDETCLAEISNNGIRSMIDLTTWIRTTRLGGGFVYCHVLQMPAG